MFITGPGGLIELARRWRRDATKRERRGSPHARGQAAKLRLQADRLEELVSWWPPMHAPVLRQVRR
jgi:hypothetical protein